VENGSAFPVVSGMKIGHCDETYFAPVTSSFAPGRID